MTGNLLALMNRLRELGPGEEFATEYIELGGGGM